MSNPFISCIPVLRRWADFEHVSPLPLDFSDWIKTNTTRALELQKKDPQLYSLLNGTASASLVADALSGVLSECPTPIEELEEQKKKAEIQQLIQENPYQTGNLTDVLKLERLDPKAAAKLREEIHYQKHEEVREEQKKGAKKQRQAIDKAVAQGQLQRLQQTAWQ